MSRLLCFGFGFSARALAARLAPSGWTIAATSRSADGRAEIRRRGFADLPFPAPQSALDGITHVLASAPPDGLGDPVLRAQADGLIRQAQHLRWVGYLSTTGVYGDLKGAWVDETAPLMPSTDRGRRRVQAEAGWLDLWRGHGAPVHVFRLAGIYGPGRNPLIGVLDGSARRVVKPGQVFSRIHVEDVAGALHASIAKPDPGAAYNACDDEPCPPQEVTAFAAELLGRPPPPEIRFEDAKLSPMAASFYTDSKRVANGRIKAELGYRLRFPTYRHGLKALLAAAL